jgi:hypothetical protein
MMYVRFPLSLLNVEDLLQWQTHLDHRIVTWDATGDVSIAATLPAGYLSMRLLARLLGQGRSRKTQSMRSLPT